MMVVGLQVALAAMGYLKDCCIAFKLGVLQQQVGMGCRYMEMGCLGGSSGGLGGGADW